MSEMGKAMMGTGEASGEGRAVAAAEAAIANPLIDDVSLKGAKGLIINITGGKDITLYEVDEAANRIKQEVDEEANIIYGTTCDERLEGLVRVSIVATGIDINTNVSPKPLETFSTLSIDNSIYNKNNKTTELANQENNVSEDISPQSSFNKIETINNLDNVSKEIDDQDFVKDINLDEHKKEINEKEFEVSKEISEDAIEKASGSDEVVDSFIDENKENIKKEASVRRLSLFDTIKSSEEESESKKEKNENLRAEPVISTDQTQEDNNTQEGLKDDNPEEELSGEESEMNDLEDDFNQETEEELLDIPTFLRRQAN